MGYLFQGQVENGGEGFLIGLHRTQSIKIAQRIQREGRKDDNTKNKTVHSRNYSLPIYPMTFAMCFLWCAL
jgi:hypothetical protein